MDEKKIWKKTFPMLRNKYVITLIVFGFWILLFDQNNLIDRYQNIRKLNTLKKEREYYQKKIKDDQRRKRELETDKKSLEKFAREQYLMKKKDEDVFVIIED